MAKSTKYDDQNKRNIAAVQRYIDRVYQSAVREAVRIGLSVGAIKADRLFSFDDFPKIHKQVENLLSRLKSSIETVVLNGIEASWTLANNKNNELSRRVFGDNVGRLTPEQEHRYFSTNDDARRAFEQRRVSGLNLSDRVWRYTDQFKSEIEMGIDIGIRNGRSAEELSRDLRDYLRYPDKLFRRVRDEHGQLVLSHRAKEFHPGQGVYRSSYKNARRLAATETNIAYRTSDHLRWQQMDFVVGIEIKLSNNHTLNGVKFNDICDTLAGKYPKDFKFTGWHPHCRCHAVSILKTDDEIAEDTRRILAGEPLDGRSVNRVDDVPAAFKSWVQDNAARVVKSSSLPYFLSDNPSYVGKAFTAAQGHTRIAAIMGQSGVFEYAEQYKGRNPKVAALLSQLDDSAQRTDIERAMMINQLKQECANITCADLTKWGVVDDTFTMSRVLRDYPINGAIQYTDASGRQRLIKPQFRDMVIFKDKYGKEFGYPVGVQKEGVLLSTTEASEVIQAFPPYLRKGINRVNFYNEPCPVDEYWKVAYKNPKHTSCATDGGNTSFWMKVDKSQFKEVMAHEAAHIIDGLKHKITSTDTWKQAVEADLKYWADIAKKGGIAKAEWGYPSKYAMTNLSEDFAESMSQYINSHTWFKASYPNRAAFIRRMAQSLSAHL